MTERAAPRRIGVVWSPEARANVRGLDRTVAMQIFHCLNHYIADVRAR